MSKGGLLEIKNITEMKGSIEGLEDTVDEICGKVGREQEKKSTETKDHNFTRL